MKKRLLIVPVILTLIDQAIKACIRHTPQGHVFFRFSPFVELTHYTNTGAAFSLFAGNAWFVALLAILLLIALFALVRGMALTDRAFTAVAFLIGGGLGNLLDRLLFGGVTDYIRILPFRFPVFNFADICITLAACYLLLLTLTGRLEMPSKENHG